ncbi:MAG: hypothetical protein QXM60_03525 [Thermoplasmatales archaeon]
MVCITGLKDYETVDANVMKKVLLSSFVWIYKRKNRRCCRLNSWPVRPIYRLAALRLDIIPWNKGKWKNVDIS